MTLPPAVIDDLVVVGSVIDDNFTNFCTGRNENEIALQVHCHDEPGIGSASGVGGAEFAVLDYEGEQARGQAKKK